MTQAERQLCPFFSCFPLYQLSRQTAFITDVQRNPIWSQRRSVMVLDKEADRTPEEASRINPAFKGKVSAEEESSCWQLSFQQLGRLRHHVTGLTGPSLDKQCCQNIHPRNSWIKKKPYRPLRDKGSPSNKSLSSSCLYHVGQPPWTGWELHEEEIMKSYNKESERQQFLRNTVFPPTFPSILSLSFPSLRNRWCLNFKETGVKHFGLCHLHIFFGFQVFTKPLNSIVFFICNQG